MSSIPFDSDTIDLLLGMKDGAITNVPGVTCTNTLRPGESVVVMTVMKRERFRAMESEITRLESRLAAAEKVIEAASRCGECAACHQTDEETIEICAAEIALTMAIDAYDDATKESTK